MKNNLVIILFSLYFFSAFSSCNFIGCTTVNVNSVAAIAKLAVSVIDLVDRLSNKTDMFSSNFSEITNLASNEIDKGTPVQEVAQFWEDKWGDVTEEYMDINKTLLDIAGKTNEYFNKLDQITIGIAEPELREKEERKNEQLKIRWKNEYDKAVSEIANLQPLMVKGNDFMQVLKLNTIREPIKNSMNELRGLSRQAKNLGVKIETFEKNARTIFNIN